MMNVYSIIAPSTQGPAAKLWTLGKNTIEEKNSYKWMNKVNSDSQVHHILPDHADSGAD